MGRSQDRNRRLVITLAASRSDARWTSSRSSTARYMGTLESLLGRGGPCQPMGKFALQGLVLENDWGFSTVSGCQRRKRDRSCSRRPPIYRPNDHDLALVKLAPLSAIKNIHEQPDNQPHEEPHPSNRRQTGHQQDAKQGAEYRNHRTERNPESAMACRVFRPAVPSPPIDTSTNANRVPMFDISANVPTSKSPDGIATKNPAIHVATAGVRYFG